jgi:serine/threonine-protein kinase mTOR
MELDEIQDIMFGSSTLADIAETCNTLAKALFYWEKEFDNSPSSQTIAKLVKTNFDLNQPEAAEGILQFAKKNNFLSDHEYTN